ncbi:MAG: ribosomal protein S18-alanine N-acetyltransferase [Culicoidibacterales bacterium]
MACKVRLMTATDIKMITMIEAETFPHPFTESDFQSALVDENKRIFVIELYEDIIGAVQSNVIAYCGTTQIDEHRVEITTFAVAKDYRGQGQAKFLLEMVLRFFQASHVQEVTLEVRPSNIAAIQLYQNFGFEQVAVRKNYYQNPNEDAYLLQKIFS